jgi:signal transduction histidine kinase
MFSRALEHFQRTISVRLSAWYAGVFIASLLLLYSAIHLSLVEVLTRNEHTTLDTFLEDFKLRYGANGVHGIKGLSNDRRSHIFLVRLATADGRTVFFSAPDHWDHDSMATLERLPLLMSSKLQKMPVSRGDTLDIQTEKLPDGRYVQVGISDHRRRTFLRHFRQVCTVIVAPMLLLAAIGGACFAHFSLRPIRDLNLMAREIVRTGQISARLAPRATVGELRELVFTFNEMLERIDGLIRSLKGTLDNVAHDLRTPLARLRGVAELALQSPEDHAQALEALADCVEESERVAALLNMLMDISEAETGAMKLRLEPVSLSALAEEVVDLYSHVAEEKDITLHVKRSGTALALADANRTRQAAANLVDNAIKYTPRGGRVDVIVRDDDSRAVLAVEDTGIGIPAEEQAQVWERLYRGDRSRSQRGLGLGLSLVSAVMHAHCGKVELRSTPGAGSIFSLYFPKAPPLDGAAGAVPAGNWLNRTKANGKEEAKAEPAKQPVGAAGTTATPEHA